MKIVRENINEGHLRDVKPAEILTKDIEELFVGDEHEMTMELAEYCQENYIECDFDDEEQIKEIKNSDDFKNYLKYEIEYRLDKIIDNLKDHIINGRVTIWRAIRVKDEWIEHLKKYGGRLGIYWSFDRWAVEDHWGKNLPHIVCVQSSVKEEHVDWVSTIKANIRPDIGEEEKEITLFKNTPLKIEKIWMDGAEEENVINISSIKDKIFKA